jgi:Spy/CpxP family protein refolding chaperone
MRAFSRLTLAGVVALLIASPWVARPVAAAELCQTQSSAADGARPKSHKWWSAEESKTEFGLTPAQSRELEAIFQSFLPALKSSKQDIDRYQREVSRLLSEASASEAIVLQAIDRLEAAQSGLSRTRTLMLFRMYRVLSPEQRAKVKQFHERQAQESGAPSARR